MMGYEQQSKGFCDKEDEEEDDEEAVGEAAPKLSPAPGNHCSSASPWFRSFEPRGAALSYDQTAPEHINFDSKLQLMDPSPPRRDGPDAAAPVLQREHMFDKVVTPSDVGKLNRLVIPKQHAEKYFPLDSSANEKGLLLNFEDRNGKPWRFRYSYWNSSQSYVMTKGWSRFVKEKQLDAGDIVSFERGVGELGKHRLFIDWRRRPDAPDPAARAALHLQNQAHFPPSLRWGRLYSLPSPLSVPTLRHQPHPHRFNYAVHPYQRQQGFFYAGAGPASPLCLLMPSAADSTQIAAADDDSPAAAARGKNKAVAKRLRLFGVNMECSTPDDSSMISHEPVASVLSPLIPSSSHGEAAPPTVQGGDVSGKGKASLSLDLDL